MKLTQLSLYHDEDKWLANLIVVILLKWVNTEWKQMAADWHDLQSIPNF